MATIGRAIPELASGIRGAENGWAELYQRNSSARATWYSSVVLSSGVTSNVDLDSYGGATVYVTGLVDVVVKNEDGTIIRRFTSGTTAAAVEVESPSFTGVDYTTGASAVDRPITLESVLDKWVTSAGKPDFNVEMPDGSTKTIEGAIASIGVVYFNPKDLAYGAVGDNVTDDTTALQACLTAAGNAGGGAVILDGMYRVTGVLNVPDGVSLLGVGVNTSGIRVDHATANCLSFSSPSEAYVRNLSLEVAAGVGAIFDSNEATIAIDNVGFAVTGAGTGVRVTGGLSDSGTIRLRDCSIALQNASARAIYADYGMVVADRCEFFNSASSSNPICATAYGAFSGCMFDIGSTSTTTALSVTGVVSSVAPLGSSYVTNNRFMGGNGTAVACLIGELAAYVTADYGNEIGAGYATGVKCVIPSSALTDDQISRPNSLTRQGMFLAVATNATPYAIEDSSGAGYLTYSMVLIARSTNASQVLSLGYAPAGSDVFVVVRNASGGNIASVSFTGVYGSSAQAVNNGQSRWWYFKSVPVVNVYHWLQVATGVDTL